MKCPFYNASDTKIVDTRTPEDDKIARRRRECISCRKRFTTYERYDSNNLIVVERDKNRGAFNKDRVYRGMKKSHEKKPAPDSVLLEATKEIEVELTHSNEREVDSSEIGELTMKKLKKIDKVTYIRFASVYRELADVRSFDEEISKLDNE